MPSGNTRKANRGGQRVRAKQKAQPASTPALTSMTLSNGDKVEFEGKLTYGKKDKTLSAGTRKLIEAWEKKREGAKVEFAYSVDKDDNEIGEKRGGKNSVTTPVRFHQFGATFSHIHPRDPKYERDVLGGTFSTQDIKTFTKTKEQTCRAAAKEGTYSISKHRGGTFDGTGLLSYIQNAEQKAKAKRRATNAKESKKLNQALKDYHAKKIDRKTYDKAYKEYQKNVTKAFNTFLVDMHQALLDGQSTYNYDYTLERRK